MGKLMSAMLFVFILLMSYVSGNMEVFAAGGGGSALEAVLDQSKAAADQKIAGLQNASLVVPEANSTYSQGLAEYQEAMGLAGTDMAGAKVHALKAMDLFTKTIQLLDRQQGSTQSDSNQTATLEQSIADSQANAAQIRALAKANGVSDSNFSDYDMAIGAASASIANGDFQSAAQQISSAQDMLDKTYRQLEDQAQANVDSRAGQFLGNTKETLSQMIQNAKSLGLPQSTIDALQTELDKLDGAKTASQIIDTTNESSQLQNAADQYDSQNLANFDKASSAIQHRINALQQIADQDNLQFAGLAQLVQMLGDIRQKMANGQASDAASELDQENSLLSGMTDVVNGAPAIVQEINTARNMSQALESKAQAQNDSYSLDQISQAGQLLDSAYSAIFNATSTDDLKSARDGIVQAEGMLNSVVDTLNGSNQQPAQTPPQDNGTQTNSTSAPPADNTNATNSTSSNDTGTSNQTSSTSSGGNSTA